MLASFPATANSVPEWLDAINMAKYKPNFESAGLVRVDQLQTLSDDILKDAGIAMVGHRKRIVQAGKELVDVSSAS